MHQCPLPCWSLYTADASSVHLLTEDSSPSPKRGAEPARTLAGPTATVHTAA
jgi:hypothetical protein